MKRILSLILVVVMLTSLLCSCSFLTETLSFCKVNFYVDNELYATKDVVIGQSVPMPKNPTKENMVFIGWRTEEEKPVMYDFSSRVIGSFDLHACFTLDAVSVSNMVAQNTIYSTVEVINKLQHTSGTMVETQISSGSGVVIDISDGYCYVLTNAHVVKKEDGYEKQTITVEDPLGNAYEAQIYKNKNKNYYAYSEDFDLALICFKYSRNHSFVEIDFGEDPKVGDYVIAIGQPDGLQNTVTYGKVAGFYHVSGNEGSAASKIDFDSIIHNAYTNHGSSGGALLDANGRLVGVSFAGYPTSGYGCAIPISQIMEFLNLFVY